MESLFVVLPAYNEEANIAAVASQWHSVVERTAGKSKLVIVDDGSKDNTFKILSDMSRRYYYLSPITKPNSGHGSTIRFAYQYALDNGADWIFQTDSDGQTDPEEFWKFWNLRQQYDFIIGSRNGRMDGFSRKVVSRVLKLVIRATFGITIKDANTPFRLMKASQLKPLLEIVPKDFFLSNVLISILIVLKKEKSTWVPITFKPRQGGVNSINLKRITKIGLKALKDFNEIKKKIALSRIEQKPAEITSNMVVAAKD